MDSTWIPRPDCMVIKLKMFMLPPSNNPILRITPVPMSMCNTNLLRFSETIKPENKADIGETLIQVAALNNCIEVDSRFSRKAIAPKTVSARLNTSSLPIATGPIRNTQAIKNQAAFTLSMRLPQPSMYEISSMFRFTTSTNQPVR